MDRSAKAVKVTDSEVLKNVGTKREMAYDVVIASEFVGPTAHELLCLVQTNPGNRGSAEVEEVAKSFASLLNRGSSQE